MARRDRQERAVRREAAHPLAGPTVAPHRPVSPDAPLTQQDVRHLQRTIGNAETSKLVARLAGGGPAGLLVVQRYAPSSRQKTELTRLIKSQWAGEEEIFTGKGGSLDPEFVTDFATWCFTHSQAVDVLETLSYSQWDELKSKKTGEQANVFATARLAYADAKAPVVAKPADPHAAAKAKIKAEGLAAGRFSDDDLLSIEANKDNVGWALAIQTVLAEVIRRETSAALAAQRTAKYGAAKTAGNLVFTAGLIRTIWDTSYAVATSGDASPNTQVGGEHADADILAAVAAWRARNGTIFNAGPGQATDFHVPGGGAPIQDKSTRLINPDPLRGRQADFISDWGGVTVNVHVDSNVHH
jgi:hypothetical protein